MIAREHARAATDRIAARSSPLSPQVRTQLEDEQDRVRDLQSELDELRSKAAKGDASASGQVRELQIEIEDLREEKEKLERRLAQALGG